MTLNLSERFRTDAADDIPYLEIRKPQNSNNGTSSSKLYWPEPKNPNGLILSYTVTYKRVDLDNVKATESCVTSHMYKSNHGETPLLPLSNGNYSVTVKATSMAGDGRPTAAKTIIIDVSTQFLTVDEWNKISPYEFFRRFKFSKPKIKFLNESLSS